MDTRGKKKLVQYSRALLCPNVYKGKSNQREMKSVRYNGGSLDPVFDTAELDCTQICKIFH